MNSKLINEALRRLEDQRYAVREELERGTDPDYNATSLICLMNFLSDFLAAVDEQNRESDS